MEIVDLNYPILIAREEELLGALETQLNAQDWSSIFILVDENTEANCWPLISAVNWPAHMERLEIPSGEEYKNIGTCEGIWEGLLQQGADRHSLLINLGGGVIGDMGGFAASTYMRGMSFLNIPTTLLSQVDASVGSKLGVDFRGLKNMIGLFADPRAVLISPDFLTTLEPRQLRSGWAEVLKHGLIRDEHEWNRLKEVDPFQFDDWMRTIAYSVRIKRNVVEEDKLEKSLRKILNFGHSIGHAIESIYLETDKELLHGEAIAEGMIAEAYLSVEFASLNKSDADQITEVFRRVYGKPDLSDLDPQEVIRHMRHDKKNKASALSLSLLDKIGDAKPDYFIEEKFIHQAVEFLKST